MLITNWTGDVLDICYTREGSSDLDSASDTDSWKFAIFSTTTDLISDMRHCIKVYFSEQVAMSEPEVARISQK